jgi:hypothetical protein
MRETLLILRSDKRVPFSNKMVKEIALAMNRALFHQKATGHIRIMKAKRNAKSAITAITHPNVTAQMALQYRDVNITSAGTVDDEFVGVKGNESW